MRIALLGTSSFPLRNSKFRGYVIQLHIRNRILAGGVALAILSHACSPCVVNCRGSN